MKPLRIFVESEDLEERTINRKSDGSQIHIRNQVGFVYGRSDMGLVEMKLRLEPNEPAYAIGVYEVAGTSVDVGEFGSLRVGFGGVKLVRTADDDVHAVKVLRFVDVLREARDAD